MRVLLADDERAIAITLADDLRRAGYEVQAASDGPEALARYEAGSFDAVITDLNMPGMSGMELLERVRRSEVPAEVIIITGYGTIDSAVDAMRKGAFDYVLKPFNNDEILEKLRKVAELRRLRTENEELREALGREKGLVQLIGKSAGMMRIIDRIRTVADRDARVLITGESGTGKERVARAIHDISHRADKPFVPLACAAIPSTLLEDEIFGHERGAFTDAKERKAGRFERAHGGTLFLDDIDDMPLETQVKLLRVVQEGEVEPLGSSKAISVDVRVIAATKVDLAAAVEDGEFREDLYYRLNVVPIDIPPLRERADDIPLLTQHFLRRFGGEVDYTIAPEVMAELCAYGWPGNVRELENAIERAIALAGRERLLAREALLEGALRRRRRTGQDDAPGGPLVTLREIVRDGEERHIRRVLLGTSGHRANAAKVLGISRKNLWEKMKDYGIE
ncbi:MAG: sigma-54 dependent transcriptional regulator [Planctomycetota bacterium]|nr:sigma-54 dependent transcriptional regulator [Planctomycetota bacterium]